MRFFLSGVALVALAACEPAVPDSGAGVGFGDYKAYQQNQAAREAKLAGQSLPAAQSVSSQPLVAAEPSPGSDLALETQAALDATRANSGEAVVNASPSNPEPVQLSNPGISDENDFAAVGSRRTIQDDAALREQNKANYQVIEPTAVPTRSGSSGPNIVDYALNTSHPVGSSQYRRTGLNLQARYQKNCAKYPSPDLAQAEFLAKGGPARDRMGLDPDGDGYACSWDPEPFRKARNG